MGRCGGFCCGDEGQGRWAIAEATLKECARAETLGGGAAVPPSQARAVRAALPKGVELVTLAIRSPTAWLGPWLPAPKGHMVGWRRTGRSFWRRRGRC